MGCPARHESLPRSHPGAAPPHYGERVEALTTRRFASGDGFELVASLLSSDDARGDSLAPVLLLHGLSQQRHFWGPVMRRMRARPVAALDQRGHGESDSPVDADYSVPRCAADALAALDDLGWPRAVVVGHSWGAAVALSTAARHPQRARPRAAQAWR